MKSAFACALLWAGCAGLCGCGESAVAVPPPDPDVATAGPMDAGLGADAGGPDAAPLEPDAGPAQPESDFRLALGIGERAFMAHPHGDVALLRRGCQGAQHVWVSLRTGALPAGDHPLRLSLHRISDDYAVVPVHTLELPWDPLGDEVALIGVTLVIFDPLPIVGELGDITAEVDAPNGRTGQIGRASCRERV